MDQNTIVLIIGGGVAGLALAQTLQRLGIKSSVYERDANPESRGLNWAVSLHSCLPDMQAMLPRTLGSLNEINTIRTSGLKDTFSIEDAVTGQVQFKWGEDIEEGDDGFLLWANRPRLRKYLLPGVEIVWNKKFDHYVEDETGVTAYFTDGSMKRGSVIVGAEGSGSHVRSQLLRALPGSVSKPLPYGVIGAEFILSAKEMEEFHEYATCLFVSLCEGQLLFVGIRDMLEDGSADAYYHLYWTDSEAAEKHHGYWTQSASKDQLYQKAQSIVQDWKGYGKTIVMRRTPSEMMSPPFMLSRFQPPDRLPFGRVTLIGDAAHTMPPYRGAGANTALSDAMDLARLFEKQSEAIKNDPKFDFASLFKDFESSMVPRAQAIVEESCLALETDANGVDPVQRMINHYDRG